MTKKFVPTIGQLAFNIANSTKQFFFRDDAGAHVTEKEGDASTGHNLLLTSVGIALRDGLNDLSRFLSTKLQLGITGGVESGEYSSQVEICVFEDGTGNSIPAIVIKGSCFSDGDWNHNFLSGSIEVPSLFAMATPSGAGISFGVPAGDIQHAGTTILSDDGKFSFVDSRNDNGFMSPLPIGSGGTGAMTLADAQSNLGITPSKATGSANFPTDWTIGAFELTKRGTEVWCRIDATYKTDITLDTDVFTIPAGFRPAAEAIAPAVWATTSIFPAIVKFEPSGIVHVVSAGQCRRLACIAKWNTAA